MQLLCCSAYGYNYCVVSAYGYIVLFLPIIYCVVSAYIQHATCRCQLLCCSAYGYNYCVVSAYGYIVVSAYIQHATLSHTAGIISLAGGISWCGVLITRNSGVPVDSIY